MKPSYISLLLVAAAAPAAGENIVLKDWTGRGFAPDLVNYMIPAGQSPRVFDADGKPVPTQVTGTTLSFVTAVAPSTTVTYTVRSDGPVAPPAVTTMKEGDALVLANQLLAVKVPAAQEKTFDKTVAAETLPAPILALRGADKTWKGEGKVLAKLPVKKFTVAQTASGPVF